jgi:hypothetical protein
LVVADRRARPVAHTHADERPVLPRSAVVNIVGELLGDLVANEVGWQVGRGTR